MNDQSHQQTEARQGSRQPRRGIVVVMTAFCLVVIFAFVALSVDSGRVVLTETQMQNAVDAASLAASQEITAAVYAAGQGQGSANIDANSIAVQEAKAMAAQVAEANGVYIDADVDVEFGKRRYDPGTETWTVDWDASPYNTVRVTARRTGDDLAAPDGRFPLAFGWAVGRTDVPLTVASTAFVEARDIVLVLDFSASMNDDSSIRSFGNLGQSNVEDSLDGMWDALVAADPQWPGTSDSKFLSAFGLIDSYEGTYISSSSTSSIYDQLGLDAEDGNGDMLYPWPQGGRYSSGLPKPKPADWYSEDRWEGYISYVKNLSGPYRKKYGYRTLMNYLQEKRYKSKYSEDLWRTPHYPFHAVKEGATLFLDFLEELEFGDEVGLVSYGKWAVQEFTHNDGEVNVDLSEDPISTDYSSVDTIQRRHQAGDYDGWTGMGDGILKARELMYGDPEDPEDGYIRYGARPTMIIMTDGQTNQGPSNFSFPSGWNWADWTDYDGDGTADYSTSNSKKKYAFWEATEAVKQGITLHTMAVGAGADRDLMEAIAFAGEGIYISVPGGATVSEMEQQMLEAFGQIAAKVPAAKLVFELNPEGP